MLVVCEGSHADKMGSRCVGEVVAEDSGGIELLGAELHTPVRRMRIEAVKAAI